MSKAGCCDDDVREAVLGKEEWKVPVSCEGRWRELGRREADCGKEEGNKVGLGEVEWDRVGRNRIGRKVGLKITSRTTFFTEPACFEVEVLGRSEVGFGELVSRDIGWK